MARLKAARASDAGEIAFDQRDAGALHRDVGAGAHRDADIGFGEGGRVVDAVASHGHDAAFAAQPPHDGVLLLGQNLGLDIGDAEFCGDRLRGDAIVAGQHDDADAVGAQRSRARPASSA